MDITFRAMSAADGAAVAQVFYDAVHLGTASVYTKAQRMAWAGPVPDPEGWQSRVSGMRAAVAEADGTLLGFITLDDNGLIDLAFVHPSVARQGLGRRLYATIERQARVQGIRKLTTEASDAARPFFEALGWSVDASQIVTKRGVELRNHRMSKRLSALDVR